MMCCLNQTEAEVYRERNEDRGGNKMGTENDMDKKPGQGTARIWLKAYCKALV